MATTATKPASNPPNLVGWGNLPYRAQEESAKRSAWKAGVLGTLNILIMVTAIRIQVMIAIGGGILLAVLALSAPDPMKLGVLAIYATMVGAVVWLASRS